jgi:hypothetical protein
MKTIVNAAIFAAVMSFSLHSTADTIKRDTTLGKKIGNTAKKVGHKTSNVAANTASHVVDKKYDGKYGPNGETIYINDKSHYYYINKKGHRVYLKKSELMDKKM